MMGFEFALFMVAWAISAGSPGPATLAIAGTSMNRGRAAGVTVAAGIFCGSATWGLAAALGLSALMAANAWIMEAMRYIAAAYLLFLAFKAMRSAFTDKPMMAVAAGHGGLHRLYVKGLLIHLTNPKAVLGWGAMFAIAVPAGASQGAIFETYGALLSVSCGVFFGYALLFSTGVFARGYQRLRRWFEGAFAVLFGLAGFKILTARLT
ncbi:MAG: threonine/homoserine/homoserine lactone efflux protein [Yoonia sp.]|jgi:threonine/homoserine/homoserine lactone efflux protein